MTGSLNSRMRFSHSARAALVHRAAAGVDRHRDRHVAHLELVDRLHAEVLEGEHARLADRLGDQIGGAADGHQVGGLVLADRLDRHRAALGLADHRDQPGLGEHRLGELVHPRRGGGAGGADDLVAHGVDRADVVDDAVGEVDRQLLALVEHVLDALVRGVAPGEQLAREQQALAGLPRRDLGRASACRGSRSRARVRRPGDVRPVARAWAARTPPAPSRRGRSARGAWRRSSGSSPPAGWRRASDRSRILTSSTVDSPPRPCAPMPSALTLS